MKPPIKNKLGLATTLFLAGLGALLALPATNGVAARSIGTLLIMATAIAVRSQSYPSSEVIRSAHYEKAAKNFKRTWFVGCVVSGSLALSSYLLFADAGTDRGGLAVVLYFTFSVFLAMGYYLYVANKNLT